MRGTVHIRDGFENHWTVLRVFMAAMVMVGHAMVIGYRDLASEPAVIGDWTLSYLAVDAFFVASGFLVTASMMHRRDTLDYGVARLLRIYPALIVHVLLVIAVVGAATTVLPLVEYFTSWNTWRNVPLVLSFVDTSFFLPGVFESNHEAFASAPIWTLRYELLAYLGTGLAYSVGLMKHRWMVAAQFGVFAVLWPLAHVTGIWESLPATVQNVLRFGLAYGFGAFLWVHRRELPLRWWVVPVMVLACGLSFGRAWDEVMFVVMVGYTLFWLAYQPVGKPVKWPDLSYGIYIWHWPLMQWVASERPEWGPLALLAVAGPATVAVAWASWTYVEEPMLKRKAAVSAWVRGRRRRALRHA